jgi:50S ribosomal subunit-associated GTPase HflX
MEINAHQPMIMVFNKIDDFSYEKKMKMILPSTKKYFSGRMEKTWMAKSKYPTVFISALTKENFPEMKKMIYDEVMKIIFQDSHTTISFSNILITTRKKTTLMKYIFLYYFSFRFLVLVRNRKLI